MPEARVAFVGTDEFAVASLLALNRSREIKLGAVASSPPKPSGRGMKLHPSPVARQAEQLGIPVVLPSGDNELAEMAARAQADFLVVCAYGRKLKKASLNAAGRACVNVHSSLLPRWRGAAPIERAIIAGDSKIGVSTMLVCEKMDAGNILLQQEMPATEGTGGQIRALLADAGAKLLIETLLGFDSIKPTPQDEAQVTYAPKIEKTETFLDLSKAAEELARIIRAFSPSPAARITANGFPLKILAAQAVSGTGSPGELISATEKSGLIVAAGSGCLKLLEVQPAGRNPMAAEEFLRGCRGRLEVSGEKIYHRPRSSAG